MITTQPKILWTQVVALAVVQGAIVLAWVIYNLYFGDLLKQFGFSAGITTLILLLENALAMIMEPLMGRFSDRAQRSLGSRFPFIAVGMILASILLITIPTVVIFGQPVEALRWLLPIVLVAWAISMAIFRSPALSLLGRYAYGSGLPQAASMLTVMGALAGAVGPFANQFILALGPAMAFGIASFVLLGAAALLRSVKPEAQIQNIIQADQSPWRSPLMSLMLVFMAGWGVVLGFRLQMFAFPQILKAAPNINVGLTMGIIFLAIAVTAIPAGSIARQIGNQRAMLLGLVGIVGMLGIMNFVHHAIAALIVAIILGTSLSLVNNGTLPFALSMVPHKWAGLGTGMFFSGGALASNLFAGVFKNAEGFTPEVLLGAAIGGWLVTMGVIAISHRFSHS